MRIRWLINTSNHIVNLQFTIQALAFKSVQLMPLKVSFLELKITNTENVWKKAYCNSLSYDCSYLQEIKFPIIPKIDFISRLIVNWIKIVERKTKLIYFSLGWLASGFGKTNRLIIWNWIECQVECDVTTMQVCIHHR